MAHLLEQLPRLVQLPTPHRLARPEQLRPAAQPWRFQALGEFEGLLHQPGDRSPSLHRAGRQRRRRDHLQLLVTFGDGDPQCLSAELDGILQPAAIGADEPAAELEQAPAPSLVVPRVGERPGEELLAVVDVEEHTQRRRLDPRRPSRQRLQQLVGHGQCPRRFPGGCPVRGRRQGAPRAGIDVAVRRHPDAVPGELGGDGDRAQPRGALGGRLQLSGNRRIAAAARQREVPGAAVRIVDDRRQLGVQRHPVHWVGAVEDHRGEQWVGEADQAVLAADEQLVGEGIGDQAARTRIVARRGQRHQRGRTECGSRAQHRQLRRGDVADARRQRGAQRRRSRGEDAVAALPGAGELDGEQRVAVGQLVDTVEHRLRKCSDRGPDGRAEVTSRERAEDELLAAIDRHDGDPLPRRTLCRQDGHGRGVEAAQRVPQRAQRDRVEPLQVVDRHHDGCVVGEAAQRLFDGSPAFEDIGVGHQRRSVRIGVLEQVDQAGHRCVQLVLAGPRHEDSVTSLTVLIDAPPPHGRLADPLRAADDDRPRARPGAHARASTSSSRSRPTSRSATAASVSGATDRSPYRRGVPATARIHPCGRRARCASAHPACGTPSSGALRRLPRSRRGRRRSRRCARQRPRGSRPRAHRP